MVCNCREILSRNLGNRKNTRSDYANSDIEQSYKACAKYDTKRNVLFRILCITTHIDDLDCAKVQFTRDYTG